MKTLLVGVSVDDVAEHSHAYCMEKGYDIPCVEEVACTYYHVIYFLSDVRKYDVHSDKEQIGVPIEEADVKEPYVHKTRASSHNMGTSWKIKIPHGYTLTEEDKAHLATVVYSDILDRIELDWDTKQASLIKAARS